MSATTIADFRREAESYTVKPRWVPSRIKGQCSLCGRRHAIGVRVLYFPITTTALCSRCARGVEVGTEL